MNIYIGYKYRNNKNKPALKETLTNISDCVCSLGHKTFILDRDIYNWKHGRTSTSKSISSILKNMTKSDIFLAFVDCDNNSPGLTFETLCAKTLGKKIIFAIQKGLKALPFKKYAHKTIEFENHEDLIDKIQSSIKSLS